MLDRTLSKVTRWSKATKAASSGDKVLHAIPGFIHMSKAVDIEVSRLRVPFFCPPHSLRYVFPNPEYKLQRYPFRTDWASHFGILEQPFDNIRCHESLQLLLRVRW